MLPSRVASGRHLSSAISFPPRSGLERYCGATPQARKTFGEYFINSRENDTVFSPTFPIGSHGRNPNRDDAAAQAFRNPRPIENYSGWREPKPTRLRSMPPFRGQRRSQRLPRPTSIFTPCSSAARPWRSTNRRRPMAHWIPASFARAAIKARGLNPGDKVLAKSIACKLIHALQLQVKQGKLTAKGRYKAARILELPS